MEGLTPGQRQLQGFSPELVNAMIQAIYCQAPHVAVIGIPGNHLPQLNPASGAAIHLLSANLLLADGSREEVNL